jgi:alkylhydroperoxidase/carboxymuconolactone decarboxylase family protein YurZ
VLGVVSGEHADIGVLARRWVFGEVWARTELSRRDRSLVVIGILTSLGASAELAVHVPAGVRHGLSPEEVQAAITHLTLYAGLPRAQEAMRTARDALAPDQ